MKINQLPVVLFSLVLLNSCSKENATANKGFITAGKNGNINTVDFKPSKLIQAPEFEYFDFNKNGSLDLCFTSSNGYPNTDSKAVLVNTNIGGGHTLWISDKPFEENDVIGKTQNWIHVTADFTPLSISDSFKNDYSTPKYFGFKLTEDNLSSVIYGWVKIGINDFNQLQVYSYSCGK